MPQMNTPGIKASDVWAVAVRVLTDYSGIMPPILKYKAPATLSQLNPTAGTYYTILEATNAKIGQIIVKHDDASTRILTVQVTLDGETMEGNAAGLAATAYYGQITTDGDGVESLTFDVTPIEASNAWVSMEGHSVKAEVKSVALPAGKSVIGTVLYGTMEV